MEFFSVINQRRSTRKFLEKPVEAEKIRKILRSILRAPSSRGTRPWEFIVVTDRDLLAGLSKARPSGVGFLKDAPLGVVVCGIQKDTDIWIENAAIAAVYAQLAAQALGLASCWAHVRDKTFSSSQSSGEYVAELLKIPPHLHVECVIGIGYPDQETTPYRDEDLPYEKVSYNEYGKRGV